MIRVEKLHYDNEASEWKFTNGIFLRVKAWKKLASKIIDITAEVERLICQPPNFPN